MYFKNYLPDYISEFQLYCKETSIFFTSHQKHDKDNKHLPSFTLEAYADGKLLSKLNNDSTLTRLDNRLNSILEAYYWDKKMEMADKTGKGYQKPRDFDYHDDNRVELGVKGLDNNLETFMKNYDSTTLLITSKKDEDDKVHVNAKISINGDFTCEYDYTMELDKDCIEYDVNTQDIVDKYLNGSIPPQEIIKRVLIIKPTKIK